MVCKMARSHRVTCCTRRCDSGFVIHLPGGRMGSH